LQYPFPDLIKEADSRICNDEYDALFRQRLGEMEWTLPDYQPLGIMIQGWPPMQAKRMFKQLFDHLEGEQR